MPQESEPITRLAVLPLLVLYSITVALTAYHLSRRVRQQAQMLAALSSTDELSHLLTQAHWKRAVLAEFHRCRRQGTGAALMMLDIDRFKEVNDRHGHPVGDAVIKAVAALVRDGLRAHDVPGRYGGDEFGVLLPGTSEDAARLIAERLRERVAATTLEAKHGVRVTLSLGIAAYDPADANPEAWIARADRALYRAKEGGRNRSEKFSSALAA
jgi:diguanylate cyclase